MNQKIMDATKIIGEFRQHEDEKLLIKSKNNLDKAVKLWEKQLKSDLKKQKLPKWWKNATTIL